MRVITGSVVALLTLLFGFGGSVQHVTAMDGTTATELSKIDDDDDGGRRGDEDDDDDDEGRRRLSSRWPAPWPTDRGRRDDPRRGDWAYRVAMENGYHHGVDKGREDADRNRSYSPERHRLYRQADSGYDRRYGSREAYRNRYREGFREGYDEGYRSWDRPRARSRTPWPWGWPF